MNQVRNRFKLKNKSSFFVTLIVFLLLFQLLTNFTFAFYIEDKKTESYIIEFKELSLLNFRKKIRDNIDNKITNLNIFENQINQHKNKLISLHQKAKNDILNFLGVEYSSEKTFSHDFTLLSNSIVIENIPTAIIEKIKSLSYVKSVEPDITISISYDDPLSWGVSKIKADKVWNLKDDEGRNITGKDVSIAILDTGIDYHHFALGGGFGPGFKVVDGYDFVTYNRYSKTNSTYWSPKDPDENPDDEHGHGTHCAGIALGVAPDASLYAYRIMNRDGVGKTSWFLEAMTRALDPNEDEDTSDHVDIISLSLGDAEGNPNDLLSQKVNEVVDFGVAVIVAAGNDGPAEGTINSPGCAEKALTVGGTNKYDHIYSSSSRGPTSTGQIKPDVVAPAVDVKSLWLNNQTVTLSGTSMAAPHVAGAAALLLQNNYDLTPFEIKDILKDNAILLSNDWGIEYDQNTQGAGRIDVLASLPSPIAILDIPDIIKRDIFDIKGTALNGTGNPANFLNYSLYYKFENDWIKITTETSEVNNSVLYSWDVTNFEPGTYIIELVVNNIEVSAFDIKTIKICSDGLNIVYNETVFEKQKFTVKIYDEYLNPTSAIVIFLPGFHLPQIKYDDTVEFTSPKILNPLKESIKGKIIVLRIKDFEIIKKEITVKK